MQLPGIVGGSEKKALLYANEIAQISAVDGYLSKGHIAEYFGRYNYDETYKGAADHKKEVFKKIVFSTYFEGYGLYEDADFSLRIAKLGALYVNTSAQLSHHHDASGRPNKFKYGKMVVRNGWYVWRVKYPKPIFKTKLKWHATAFLLTIIRFSNIFNSKQKKEILSEQNNRLGKKINVYEMEEWQSLQLDDIKQLHTMELLFNKKLKKYYV